MLLKQIIYIYIFQRRRKFCFFENDGRIKVWKNGQIKRELNKEWNQNEGQRHGGKGAVVYVRKNDFY
jgi:hypothetical protein